MLAAVATLGPAAPQPLLQPAPPDVDARALAERAENVLRGDTTYARAQMTVHSPRLMAPRRITFRSWNDRNGQRSFIRILEPTKDSGMGYLKLHPNLWNYIPKVERTVRIPPSMMQQPWMGSDFTNDDLVRESSEVDDYEHRVLGIDSDRYVLEYLPHEDAAVVWGRIVSWIERDTGTPRRQDFYDEDGVRVRTLRFDDVRPVSGRLFPHLWSLQPLEKEGHKTTVAVEDVRFNEPIADTIFTTRHLRSSGRR